MTGPSGRSTERRQEAELRDAIVATNEATSSLHRSPALLAWTDQHQAAARLVGRLVTRDMPAHLAANGPKWTSGSYVPADWPAIIALVVAAMQRRQVTYCSHFDREQARHRPVLVSLGARRAVCRTCLVRTPDPADDGRCDVCDRAVPDGIFYPFVLSIGTAIVQGDTGDCCSQAVTEATASAETAAATDTTPDPRGATALSAQPRDGEAPA
jgi:hypothetical protein